MNTLTHEIQNYESGIADLRQRIAQREAEVARMRHNTTEWAQMNARIRELECMCAGMEYALHQEREYTKVEVSDYE